MISLSDLKIKKKESEGNEKSVHDLGGKKFWVRCAGGIPNGPSASTAGGDPAGPAAGRGPASQPEELRLGSAWGLFGVEVRPRSAARLPRAPPYPSSLPPLGGPLRETGKARRGDKGEGGVLSEKSSTAPERRPRVINKLRFCPGATTTAGRRIYRACSGS